MKGAKLLCKFKKELFFVDSDYIDFWFALATRPTTVFLPRIQIQQGGGILYILNIFCSSLLKLINTANVFHIMSCTEIYPN